jgi:hypothetical protein
MHDKLTKIFKNATYQPSPELAFSVLQTITKQEKRATQARLWFLSSLLFVSAVGLIPAFEMLLNNLAQSGFSEYFSLIFSDGGSMLTYWKELSFSLAESLPVMSIILTLSTLFVCFLSLRYLIKQIGKNNLMSAITLSI